MITIADIFQWLPHYKYIVLFPLMIVGGPAVTVISGSLVAAKSMDFLVTYFIIILADLTGDSLYYGLGRWGGTKLLRKWGHFFKIDEARNDQLQDHFKNNGVKTLIFGKFTQVFGSVVLIAAGVAKMPYGSFFTANLIITIVKSLFFLLIGYYFLQIYFRIHYYSVALAVFFGIMVLFSFLIYNYIKGKKLKGKSR